MDWLDVHTMLRSIFVRFGTNLYWPWFRLALTNKLTNICMFSISWRKRCPICRKWISNWTLLRNYLLTEHENRLWLQINSLFSCTSLNAWMITSTAARIELLVWKANARSSICAHCVQSADLQVCCPTSFTSLPNDLSPEGPAAVGIAHKSAALCLPQLLRRVECLVSKPPSCTSTVQLLAHFLWSCG